MTLFSYQRLEQHPDPLVSAAIALVEQAPPPTALVGQGAVSQHCLVDGRAAGQQGQRLRPAAVVRQPAQFGILPEARARVIVTRPGIVPAAVGDAPATVV